MNGLSAAGCVHRNDEASRCSSAAPIECRRYPASPVLGGTREHPQTVYRFAPCLARCGEYQAKPATDARRSAPNDILAEAGCAGYHRTGDEPPPPRTSGMVCRGCYALGSACGRCQRCADERARMKVGDLVRYQFIGDGFISACEVYQIERPPRKPAIVHIREAMGGRMVNL